MCALLLSHTVDSWLFILFVSITPSHNNSQQCLISSTFWKSKTFLLKSHKWHQRETQNIFNVISTLKKNSREDCDSWWVSAFPSIAERTWKKRSNFPSSSSNLNQTSKSVCWMFISVDIWNFGLVAFKPLDCFKLKLFSFLHFPIMTVVRCLILKALKTFRLNKTKCLCVWKNKFSLKFNSVHEKLYTLWLISRR